MQRNRPFYVPECSNYVPECSNYVPECNSKQSKQYLSSCIVRQLQNITKTLRLIKRL